MAAPTTPTAAPPPGIKAAAMAVWAANPWLFFVYPPFWTMVFLAP